jgi:hypothetical protein
MLTVIYAAKLAQRDRDRFDRAVGRAASGGFGWHEAADFGRRFVLAQAFVDYLAKQVVLCPSSGP